MGWLMDSNTKINKRECVEWIETNKGLPQKKESVLVEATCGKMTVSYRNNAGIWINAYEPRFTVGPVVRWAYIEPPTSTSEGG